jgi:outer membrane protein assembly factor BamB
MKWKWAVVLSLVVLCSAGCDWTQYLGGAAHTASGDDTSIGLGNIASVHEILTRVPGNTGDGSDPVIAGGRVFVMSGDGVLSAYDQKTMTLEWHHPTWVGAAYENPPVVINGRVFVATQNGEIWGWNVDGTPASNVTNPVRLAGELLGPISVAYAHFDGSNLSTPFIYVATQTGCLYALDVDKDTPDYTVKGLPPMAAAPTVVEVKQADGTITSRLFIGDEAGVLHSFDAFGLTNPMTYAPVPGAFGTVSFANNTVYAPVLGAGVFAFDARDAGSRSYEWAARKSATTAPFPGIAGHVAVYGTGANSKVFFVTANGVVHAAPAATGIQDGGGWQNADVNGASNVSVENGIAYTTGVLNGTNTKAFDVTNGNEVAHFGVSTFGVSEGAGEPGGITITSDAVVNGTRMYISGFDAKLHVLGTS